MLPTIPRFVCVRRGAAAIMVIFMFVAMMLMGFLALKIANIQRHMVAAQVSSDSATRWGVDALSRANTDSERRQIDSQVRDLVWRNYNVDYNSSSQNYQLNRKSLDVDVIFGNARPSGNSFKFVPNKLPLNSAKVNVSGDILNIGPFDGMDDKVTLGRTSTSMALERDICLVIDRSGSMLFDLNTDSWMYDYSIHPYNKMSTSSNRYINRNRWQWWHRWPHPTNSRWSSMIPAVYGLAEELEKTNQKELLSIVSYSTASSFNFYDHDLRVKRYSYQLAETESEPTRSYQEAVRKLDQKYKYEKPVAGGTNISAGIDQAAKVLTSSAARPNAFKTVILMTDGQQNQGRASWIAAAEAANKGIEIHTVTFGKKADQSGMKRTAEAAGGKHFHAPNGDALEEVFREIANMPPSALIE